MCSENLAFCNMLSLVSDLAAVQQTHMWQFDHCAQHAACSTYKLLEIRLYARQFYDCTYVQAG